MRVGTKCQGYAADCRGMPGERKGEGTKCQANAGEYRGMLENARNIQGNVWDWVQSASRRMPG